MMSDTFKKNRVSAEGAFRYAGAAVRRLPEKTLAV
jgi:hypothetical protein